MSNTRLAVEASCFFFCTRFGGTYTKLWNDTEKISKGNTQVREAFHICLPAWLAQLVNAPTQMHVQLCTVEVQLHSRADSLTQASILPRSVE